MKTFSGVCSLCYVFVHRILSNPVMAKSHGMILAFQFKKLLNSSRKFLDQMISNYEYSGMKHIRCTEFVHKELNKV